MKFDIEVLKETKNKRGEIKSKTIRVTNNKSKEGLSFTKINEFYRELLSKYPAKDITITGKHINGGWTTLKHTSHVTNDLKYVEDNYFSSAPKEIADKFTGLYYSIDVIINK